MEEFEDFGNQTEQVEDVQETPIDTPETVEAPPQEEPKGIKVKYNKEEMFVPETELPTYVQKGLNYDKVQQQLEETRQQAAYLDRLASMSGYGNTQEFLQAVEQAEQQRQIQEQSQRMGIDEQTYQQYFQPVNQRLQAYESEIQQLRTERLTAQIERQVNDLESKYPDFKNYANDAFNLAATRGYDLEHAYILASHQDRVRQAEQQTIKNLQQNAATTPGALGESAEPPKLSVSNMSKDQFADMVRRVKNGESITL